MKRALAIFVCITLFFTAFATAPAAASAEEKTAQQWADELGVPVESIVMPTGGKELMEDMHNVRNAQAACNQVTLLPGCTYYLDSCIYPASGFKLTATGATIYMRGRTGILWDRDSNKPGYTNTVGIYIEGGNWLVMANKKPHPVTAMQFIHARDITVKNMKITTDFAWHIIEFIGCKDALVEGCTLEMTTHHYYPDDKNEAIQIDFASGGANARNVYPDKTACENITISNNTIKFFRGVATNVKAGSKEYKIKYKNINISGNTITTTRGQGIYATNVYNLTAENNKFRGSFKTPVFSTRKLSGTTNAPKEGMARLTVKSLKKGLKKITGTMDKSGKLTVTIGGVQYPYTKKGKTFTVTVSKLVKGAAVIIDQMCGNGNIYRYYGKVK